MTTETRVNQKVKELAAALEKLQLPRERPKTETYALAPSERQACIEGIAALTLLFGYCEATDANGADAREPECSSCQASVLIDRMRAMLAEG